MVSGIGPKQTLQEQNIPMVKDAPGVGQNMWDHILFGISYRVNVLTASNSLNKPAAAAAVAKQFKESGSGPLAAFGAGYYGWEKLPQPYRDALGSNITATLENNVAPDWPELEWLPVSAFLGYQRNRQTEDPRDGYNYATLNAGLVAPLSRGNVTIRSCDMTVPPVINPNWLTHPGDQALAIQAFKRTRELWSLLQKAGLTIGDEYFPGFNVTLDVDILDFISRSFMRTYHAAATCKMGRANDSQAVVDTQARVYGVQGPRVVDASSFPFLTPGHPQSVIYALAEKIAAKVLESSAPPPGYNMAGVDADKKLNDAKASASVASKPLDATSIGSKQRDSHKAWVVLAVALLGSFLV